MRRVFALPACGLGLGVHALPHRCRGARRLRRGRNRKRERQHEHVGPALAGREPTTDHQLAQLGAIVSNELIVIRCSPGSLIKSPLTYILWPLWDSGLYAIASSSRNTLRAKRPIVDSCVSPPAPSLRGDRLARVGEEPCVLRSRRQASHHLDVREIADGRWRLRPCPEAPATPESASAVNSPSPAGNPFSRGMCATMSRYTASPRLAAAPRGIVVAIFV